MSSAYILFLSFPPPLLLTLACIHFHTHFLLTFPHTFMVCHSFCLFGVPLLFWLSCTFHIFPWNWNPVPFVLYLLYFFFTSSFYTLFSHSPFTYPHICNYLFTVTLTFHIFALTFFQLTRSRFFFFSPFPLPSLFHPGKQVRSHPLCTQPPHTHSHTLPWWVIASDLSVAPPMVWLPFTLQFYFYLS